MAGDNNPEVGEKKNTEATKKWEIKICTCSLLEYIATVQTFIDAKFCLNQAVKTDPYILPNSVINSPTSTGR